MKEACWCGEVHGEPTDQDAALRKLGHELLATLHIPELTAWLARKVGPR